MNARHFAWNRFPQRAMLGFLAIVSSGGFNLAYAQNATEHHSNESRGPRPLSGYEDVYPLARDSEFRAAATPVGQILLKLENRTLPMCSGILISPKYVLTARHCLQFEDPATNVLEDLKPSGITFELDYLEYGTSATKVSLKTEPIERGPGDLDFMVLETTADVSLKSRRIPAGGQDPTAKQDLYIIHYPGGQILEVSRYGCRASEKPLDGHYLRHRCDTDEGSSGAPIFNTHFELMGIHLSGGKSDGYDNIGLLLSAIESQSSIVKTALKTYGTKEFPVQAAKPQELVALKFVLPNGQTITKNQTGWMLVLAPQGGKSVPLRQQAASDNDNFLLWDPTNDEFYLVPKNGGTIKQKGGSEMPWTDIGKAVKK
jgi:hypothetical protein